MYSVSDFKAKAAEFGNAFRSLENDSRVKGNPELEKEREALLSKGNMIKRSIAYVTNGLDTFTKWGRETFGLDSTEHLHDEALGLLPLLPIAGIAGAGALMTGWLTSVYKFNKKLAKIASLEKKGVAPEKAFKLVNSLDTGFEITAKGMIPLLGGAALLFFFLRNK